MGAEGTLQTRTSPQHQETFGTSSSSSSAVQPEPAAVSAIESSTVQSDLDDEVLALPAFDVCDDDVEPTDHYFVGQATLGTKQLMLVVRREMNFLRKGLLEGEQAAPIVVRTFSSRSDLFR